jgi:hypothetical protein
MEIDNDPFGFDEEEWEGTELSPYNIWSVGFMHHINEDGVGKSVVLYLASDQTGDRIGLILHPHTAASIGIDLMSAYVAE